MLADKTELQTVTLTPAAIEAVRKLMKDRNLEGHALRVYVAGSGCSGLQYGLALEENIREQDHITEFDGVKLVVDEVSIDYLRGSTVDFIDDERGSGFRIDNPNAVSPCCGDNSGCSSGCGGCG